MHPNRYTSPDQLERQGALWTHQNQVASQPASAGLRSGWLPDQEEIKAKEAYMQREAQREAANQRLAEPSPMKEIPNHMNRLFNATEFLEARVMTLEESLAPVLGPEYPSVANSGEIKANVNTGLGQAIDGIVERLENVAARMEGLIERVQV